MSIFSVNNTYGLHGLDLYCMAYLTYISIILQLVWHPLRFGMGIYGVFCWCHNLPHISQPGLTLLAHCLVCCLSCDRHTQHLTPHVIDTIFAETCHTCSQQFACHKYCGMPHFSPKNRQREGSIQTGITSKHNSHSFHKPLSLYEF